MPRIKDIIDMFFAQKTLYSRANGTYNDPKENYKCLHDYQPGKIMQRQCRDGTHKIHEEFICSKCGKTKYIDYVE